MHFIVTVEIYHQFVVHLRGEGAGGDIPPLIRKIDITRGEWSDSRSSRFDPNERDPGFELNKSLYGLNSLRKKLKVFGSSTNNTEA